MFYRIIKQEYDGSWSRGETVYQSDNWAMVGGEFYRIICDLEEKRHLLDAHFKKWVEMGYVNNGSKYYLETFEQAVDAQDVLVTIDGSVNYTTSWAGFYAICFHNPDMRVRAFIGDVDVTPEPNYSR